MFEDFTEALQQIAPQLGIASGVLITLLAPIRLALRIKGWHDDIRQTAMFTRAGRIYVRRAIAILRKSPPLRMAIMMVASLAVLVAQLIILGVCFLVGNLVSMLGNKERQQLFDSLFAQDPAQLFNPDKLTMILTADWVSMLFVLAAAYQFAKSYHWWLQNGDRKSTGKPSGGWFAAPAVLVFIFAGPIALMFVLIHLILIGFAYLGGGGESFMSSYSDNPPTSLFYMFLLAAVSFLYALLCKLAVTDGPRLVVQTWLKEHK